VSTAILIDDLKKRADSSDQLAKLLAAQWQYPLEMIFVTPAGKVISKLNSYEDFPGTHADVAGPPQKKHVRMPHERAHVDVFLKHVADHFGAE
jgi:hypothetical protein